MTRRVHRVPLGPFLVLFLVPLFSSAQSTLRTIKSTTPTPSATLTITVSPTTSNTASPSATAAKAAAPMLATFSWFGIGVGCTVLVIFTLTAFFSWRQKSNEAQQPPMTNAKKEILEYFQNRQDLEMNGGQNGVGGVPNVPGSMPDSNGSSVNLISNPANGNKSNHERNGSKSSLSKFNFNPFTKSKAEEDGNHILNIEVTSNPNLRPVDRQNVMPDYLMPKNLDPQAAKAPPSSFRQIPPPAPVPPMPRFNTGGRVIHEDPAGVHTSDRNPARNFSPGPAQNRRPPPAQFNAPKPFTMQGPLSSPPPMPQASMLKPKEIPRHLRPTSSTTIASNSTRHSGEYETEDEDEYDDNRSYRSRDSQDSIDSYYLNPDRGVSGYSEASDWSYGPSHSSHNVISGHVYDYSPAPLNHSKKAAPVVNEHNQDMTSQHLYPPRTTSRKIQQQFQSIDHSSRMTPPPPPKDWEVVPVQMEGFPSFVATVKPSPSPGPGNVSRTGTPVARTGTPRSILKNGGNSNGLPMNPRPAKAVEWYHRDPQDIDVERDGNLNLRTRYV
ncbi:hypothetical protein TWF694_001309 [Orbilia ellipsospora]|uniref:Uncharacterized protein n=1 Tax=Orbilia ellipsospora TaxID=2528407 RepID=A0AAV9XS13_9PEZI